MSWKLEVSASGNPQGLYKDCFTFFTVTKVNILVINCYVDSVCLFVCLLSLSVFLVCNYWNFKCKSCLMSLWIEKILGKESAKLVRLCGGSAVQGRLRHTALNQTGPGSFTCPKFVKVQVWIHSRTTHTVAWSEPSDLHEQGQALGTVSTTDCFRCTALNLAIILLGLQYFLHIHRPQQSSQSVHRQLLLCLCIPTMSYEVLAPVHVNIQVSWDVALRH
jgi:hypothetical protein